MSERDRKLGSTDYAMPFYMVDSAARPGAKLGLTPVVTLSKDGAAFGVAAGAVSEIGNGWYELAGNAVDRNTLGPLLLNAVAFGADDANEEFLIVEHDPVGAILAIQAKTDGLVFTGTDVKATLDGETVSVNNLGTDALDADALAADAVAEIAAACASAGISLSLANAIRGILYAAKSNRTISTQKNQFDIKLFYAGETDELVRFSFWA